MTRCIHCLRCVRFSNLLGTRSFGILNRSNNSEIVYHFSKYLDFSGTTIDLCPVGALTAKNNAFTNRPWELKIFETIDILNSFGSNLYVSFKDFDILKISPKSNIYINGNSISDSIRFSFDANSYNRLKFIYEFNTKTASYQPINWNFFFPKINSYFSKLNNIFLINNFIGLNTLILLKKICYVHINKIKLYVINSNIHENLYFKHNENISNLDNFSDICFLIFFNPEKTNPLIFLKLKLYNKKKFFDSISNKSNFINQFLTTKQILQFFTGKLHTFSKKLYLSFQPLILFGENFQKRFLNFKSFILKKKICFKHINITSGSNSESLNLLNVQTFNKQINKKTLFLVNLEDTLNIRKLIDKNQMNKSFWFSTHKIHSFFKFKFIIPISTFLEEENILINFEHRVQKTEKFNSGFLYIKSFFNLLKTIFYTKNYFIKFIYLKFFYELLKTPNLLFTTLNFFNKIIYHFTNYTSFININSIKNSLFLQNTTIWLKNSLSSRQNFYLKKTKFTNFISSKVPIRSYNW